MRVILMGARLWMVSICPRRRVEPDQRGEGGRVSTRLHRTLRSFLWPEGGQMALTVIVALRHASVFVSRW